MKHGEQGTITAIYQIVKLGNKYNNIYINNTNLLLKMFIH